MLVLLNKDEGEEFVLIDPTGGYFISIVINEDSGMLESITIGSNKALK